MPDTSEFDIQQLRASAAQAAVLLRSLAHEDRLLLLCKLSQQEMCVGDLETELGIHQPSLSQQLGVLRRQGLVSTRREGKNIYYRVADERALAVLQALYELYCGD